LLSDNPIGQPFIQLTEVESSNNYAMAEVQAQMAEHGKTWFAHHQTAGKGQRGKSWMMNAGQNIMLSIVIEPFCLHIGEQFKLSAAIATACYDFFKSYALDETRIKWPNDIYWKDRKAGGILIENVLQGNEWKYAIVGIGININQTDFPKHLPNPVSLKQITGKEFNPVDLARELCSYIDERWKEVASGSFSTTLEDYNNGLYKAGEEVSFRKQGEVIKARVSSVNMNGQLMVNDGNEGFSFGEVEWLFSY
jgi:BirA family biotin operon repressor/biotin-[acetyl-CoA-carboxylase] ligase